MRLSLNFGCYRNNQGNRRCHRAASLTTDRLLDRHFHQCAELVTVSRAEGRHRHFVGAGINAGERGGAGVTGRIESLQIDDFGNARVVQYDLDLLGVLGSMPGPRSR